MLELKNWENGIPIFAQDELMPIKEEYTSN